uniref:Secreted protein n=1 Tax=Rhizophora mucronata TaxID=61149 RepID=A0A2P2NFP4_RHIMU
MILSNATRFSSLRGNPSMTNFLLLLCCIACCRSFTVTSEGTIFPSFLKSRIIFPFSDPDSTSA